MATIEEAKQRLDLIIGKSRVDSYKTIHIAEVLHRSRTVGDFDIAKLETFQNPSLRWRNEVTQMHGFESEFPLPMNLAKFLEERDYNNLEVPEFWDV
jgi:hypothetical protein